MSQNGLRRTHPLGVFRDHDSIGIIGRDKYSTTSRLRLGHGHGLKFQLQDDSLEIVLPLGRKQSLEHISNARIAYVLDQPILTYTALHEGVREVRIATRDADEEMEIWDVASYNRHLTGSGVLVPDYKHSAQYVLVYGERNLHIAFSKNLVAWHPGGEPLAKPRRDRFDKHALQVVAAERVEQGIMVVYVTAETKKGLVNYSVGALMLDADNPEHVSWRCDDPLATYSVPAKHNPGVLGAVVYEREIVMYLTSDNDKLLTFEMPNPFIAAGASSKRLQLHRFARNPILSPTANEWESLAVFNPAAMVDNGRVHLLYRALGPDGVSRIGYASSADGIHFDERLPLPVYTPMRGFGGPSEDRGAPHIPHYDIMNNPSGGGWAGCEDPRIVKIEDRAYMTYCAFDGWDFMRQAMTSIHVDDMALKNWKWRKPVLISKPDQPAKNWLIFPEKIGGKYAVLHGLSPKIHIEYVDDLDELNGSKFIESLPPAHGNGYHDPRRKHHWDTRVRGAGAPPIKTEMGWLLLYHATDRLDPGKYKLGAMILDLNDPTQILYRTDAPILEPKEWYENDGKPGVVYTCGAVTLGENLIVYYGGGDKHIAIARANLMEFLHSLAAGREVSLTPVK